MNITQRIILAVFCITILLVSVVFVPWRTKVTDKTNYAPIWYDKTRDELKTAKAYSPSALEHIAKLRAAQKATLVMLGAQEREYIAKRIAENKAAEERWTEAYWSPKALYERQLADFKAIRLAAKFDVVIDYRRLLFEFVSSVLFFGTAFLVFSNRKTRPV